jgi:tetratricopeptide (TPR) repeat protein
MRPFSHSLDTHTGSYVAKRRRKRLAVVGISIAAAMALAAVGIRLGAGAAAGKADLSRPVSKKTVLAAWGAKKWDEVLASSTASLASAPLDAFYLAFKGFAAFYKGVELPEGEDRAALLDESVKALRKALVVGGPMPRAKIEYILGKAYFLNGRPYYDESAKYMGESIAHGYVGADSKEYLALSLAGLGEREKALEYFESALADDRSELLLLAAARTYVDAGKAGRAEALLLEAVSNGLDAVVRERCRFLLDDIYRSRGESAKREEQIYLVLHKNPDSAEAHYRLGLVLQEKGESVRARAEWRRAVAIDPMHEASRQKLAEKL